MLRAYRLSSLQGDRYAGEWPKDAFRKYVEYRIADHTKAEPEAKQTLDNAFSFQTKSLVQALRAGYGIAARPRAVA